MQKTVQFDQALTLECVLSLLNTVLNLIVTSVPQHLHTFLRQNIFFLYNNSYYKRLNTLQRNFVKAVLRLELKDTLLYLNFTRINIFNY